MTNPFAAFRRPAHVTGGGDFMIPVNKGRYVSEIDREIVEVRWPGHGVRGPVTWGSFAPGGRKY